MNIDKLVLAIGIAHKARISLFVHGIQGLGKSNAIKIYTKNNFHFDDGIVPYGYVDLRCASMESSEIRGLPDKDIKNKTVVYFPPDELPKGEWINNKGETFGEVGSEKPKDDDDTKWVLHRGVLVLEEINRAEDDIHQAIFQLVYDYKIGKWSLPTGWSIVATGNPTGGGFRVNSFMHEDAFKDRFIHITVEVDDDYMKGWINFMSGLKGINDDILVHITQFCSLQMEGHLYNPTQNDDIEITPSPRSWELVAKVEQVFHDLKSDSEDIKAIRFEMLSGIVGQAIASHYIEAKIKVTPKDVINNFNSIKKILEGMERNQIQAISWGVSAYVMNIALSEDQINNIVAFGKWILFEQSTKNEDCRDLAIAYFSSVLGREQKENIKKLSFVNESIQRLLKKNNVNGPIWTKMHEDKELDKMMRSCHLGNYVKQ